MKTKIQYNLFLLALITLVSCQDKLNTQKITTSGDYNSYIENQAKLTLAVAENELTFWNNKYQESPNQYPYLSKIASANTNKFMISGNIDALIEAELKLIQLNEKTNFYNASHLRALARNYISQHKFKEALHILLKAKENGEKLLATKKMLFDVYLELGNTTEAVTYLNAIKDLSDFDYLIRLSKYSDHQGNLDAAIKYLEKAMIIAEASNISKTKQWTYTNLADYYGHAGRINDSYNYYLKALAIDNSDAYAKKGIAWIVYSHEHNPSEALRILNSISKYNYSPDYHLLKAEIAEFMNDNTSKEASLVAFDNAISNQKYGAMYNAYKIELLSEEKTSTKEAVELAKLEIENRATPQAYDLLAWSYLNNGNAEKALKIMQDHVIDKTFEPTALYHIAEVYKANGKEKEAQVLKKELLEATFELGPVAEQRIKKI